MHTKHARHAVAAACSLLALALVGCAAGPTEPPEDAPPPVVAGDDAVQLQRRVSDLTNAECLAWCEATFAGCMRKCKSADCQRECSYDQVICDAVCELNHPR